MTQPKREFNPHLFSASIPSFGCDSLHYSEVGSVLLRVCIHEKRGGSVRQSFDLVLSYDRENRPESGRDQLHYSAKSFLDSTRLEEAFTRFRGPNIK